MDIQELPRGICIKIRDDGKSFRVQPGWQREGSKRLGLLGMRERLEMVGGQFGVESTPGKGTTIVAELPSDKAGTTKKPVKTLRRKLVTL